MRMSRKLVIMKVLADRPRKQFVRATDLYDECAKKYEDAWKKFAGAPRGFGEYVWLADYYDDLKQMTKAALIEVDNTAPSRQKWVRLTQSGLGELLASWNDVDYDKYVMLLHRH